MEIIVHRVNRREQLKRVPSRYGLEIDLRAEGSDIILNHDPFKGGDRFRDWLEDYRHGTLVLNVKEAGIETEVIRLAEARGVSCYFLLDVEFPYIYRATRCGQRKIAMRYSEDECIETVLKYREIAEWVWIDTNTRLPLDPKVVRQLAGFKTCLVCPERWGRPNDIPVYAAKMDKLRFTPNAVMTSLACAGAWESLRPAEPAGDIS